MKTCNRAVPSFGLKVSLRPRTLPLSKANITSKRRKSSSFTCLARWLLTIPCFFNTCNPRSFEGSPSRTTWVPALSISHSFLSSRSCKRCLKIASAVGERQVLPRQTNRRYFSIFRIRHLRLQQGEWMVKCLYPNLQLVRRVNYSNYWSRTRTRNQPTWKHLDTLSSSRITTAINTEFYSNRSNPVM